MPVINCPNCREQLDVPAELVGQTIRCGACQGVIEPGMVSLPVARTLSVRREVALDEAGFGEEVPRPKRSLMWLWMLLGIGGLSCAGCCGALGYLGFKVENPTWTKYAAPGRPIRR